MSISSKLKKRFKELSDEQTKKLIKKAWEYKTTYKEIEKEYGFTPNEMEKFMLYALNEKDFKRWKIKLQKRFNLKGKGAK